MQTVRIMRWARKIIDICIRVCAHVRAWSRIIIAEFCLPNIPQIIEKSPTQNNYFFQVFWLTESKVVFGGARAFSEQGIIIYISDALFVEHKDCFCLREPPFPWKWDENNERRNVIELCSRSMKALVMAFLNVLIDVGLTLFRVKWR